MSFFKNGQLKEGERLSAAEVEFSRRANLNVRINRIKNEVVPNLMEVQNNDK